MPATDIAQWILRHSATPERAESVIGDLLEQAPQRGAFWFWRSVLQTALLFLLPVLADATVIFLLLYTFADKGSRGFLYMTIGVLIWTVAMDKLFRWPPVRGRLAFCFLWSVLIVILAHFLIGSPQKTALP
jgi:hypothetical protein